MSKKIKGIIIRISCIIIALLLASGVAALIYTIPRNVKLPDLEGDNMFRSKNYSLEYDTDNGAFSVSKNGVTIFKDAVCQYTRDGEEISSAQYSRFDIQSVDSSNGCEIKVFMTQNGLWDMEQSFIFFNDREYFLTQVTLYSDNKQVSTNHIAPLVIRSSNLQNNDYKWEKSLEVPFDNDGWVKFNVKQLWQRAMSYEVGALFTPDNGSGFVLGSLNHDKWKTGISVNGSFGKVNELTLYCGATDPHTGDEPHGAVTGESVSSPQMFIGVFDNWKDGMNTFARANTDVEPKRTAVTQDVPFGWNSWGSVQTNINYDTAVKTSDYIKNNLQSVWQKDGAPVYVNLDSWWDMLSDEELKAFVDHCHKNNQKAGIYIGPFVMWDDEEGMKNRFVPGTNDTVTYQDIRLKKSDGSYYGNEVDGCYPLDVTHPATKLHVKNQIDRFNKAGFDYIKLDFLVHASFEGDYYDSSIETGIEAYNYAMSYITEMIGDNMFINLAMSPTFPYQYANGRRLACDSFYSIGETEYTLNAVTYGFWEKELYDYPDPDHIVIWGKDAKATEAEARSRITSGVISGTSFLAGDNFVEPAGDAEEAYKRYEILLTNEDIVRVAKLNKIFVPVITDTSNQSADIYKLTDGDKEYIAIFNFSSHKKSFEVSIDIGSYTATELWSRKVYDGEDTLTVKLNGKDAALFEIE